MKSYQITCLICLLSLLGCGKFIKPAAPTEKVEFRMVLDAPNWLLRQSARPISPNLQKSVQELSEGLSRDSSPPMDVLEPILTSHGWMDSLVHWLPNIVRPEAEQGKPMNQLQRAWDAALKQVQMVVERRLSSYESQVYTDNQGCLHVIVLTEEGKLDRINNLLMMQGELGFYETRTYEEVLPELQRLRQASYQFENGDTTFDLMKLNYKNEEFYGQVTPELELIAYRPVIFYGAEADTSRIIQVFRSDSALKIFPQTTFCWGSPTSPEYPDAYPLIALKTDHNGRPRLDGSHVTKARQDFEPNTETPMVSIEMDDRGAAEWARMTRGNLQRCVAIVFDGVVKTYPTVQTEITGGRSQITGNFTVDEARDLANAIKGGAYPARMDMVEMSLSFTTK